MTSASTLIPTPIQASPSRKDTALDAIRRMILTGDLKAGELYCEGAIAKALGVSRTPVREALAILAADGIVEQAPGVGVRVRTISPDEVHELVTLRFAIESLIIEKLTEIIDQHGACVLERAIKRCRSAAQKNRRAEFLLASAEFHLELAKLARLPHALSLLRPLQNKICLVGAAALDTPSKMDADVEDHERIVDAVLRHHRGDALRALEEHLQNTCNRINAT